MSDTLAEAVDGKTAGPSDEDSATPPENNSGREHPRAGKTAGKRDDAEEDAGADTHQFLTFVLQEELFAVDITTVREVLDCIRITRLPKSRPHILGIINLRGNVVSVTDLRRCIGMQTMENPEDGCIIIIDVEEEGDTFPVGLLADSVEAVVDLTEANLEAAPKVGMNLKPEFTNGVARIEEEYAIILAADRIVLSDELRK